MHSLTGCECDGSMFHVVELGLVEHVSQSVGSGYFLCGGLEHPQKKKDNDKCANGTTY